MNGEKKVVYIGLMLRYSVPNVCFFTTFIIKKKARDVNHRLYFEIELSVSFSLL